MLRYKKARGELDGDPKKIEAAAQSAQALESFRARCGETENFIVELETWDGDDAAGLRGELTALQNASKSKDPDYPDLAKQALALQKKAIKARNNHASAYFRAADDHRKRLDLVTKGQSQLETKKLKKEQLAQLTALVGQAEAILTSGCNSAALAPLAALLTDAEQLLQDLKNAQTMNSTLEKRLKTIESTIKKGLGSKAIRQADYKAHGEALAALQTGWVSMTPSKAHEESLQLQLAVDESVRQEGEQKAWREATLKKIAEERKYLKNVSDEFKKYLKEKREKSTDYNGHIVADLALCEEWTQTKESRAYETTVEAKLARAHSDIQGLIIRFRDGDKRDMAMVELLLEHKEAEEAASKAEQDRQRFLTECGNFETTIKMMQKQYPAMQTYPEDMKQIKERLKMAKDQGKKGGNVANGRRLLENAGKALTDLANRKPKLDRKSLGNIGRDWAAAVGQFEEKIKTLTGEVTKGAGDDRAAKQRASDLSGQLEAVLKRFDPKAFDAVAAVMGDEKQAPSSRLRAREQALAAVRGFNDIVTGDALVKLCVANPFSVQRFVQSLTQKLREIELEVLRGV